MRFWWVNQNQTFHQESTGGYLWSPKRNANGAKNPFYETMREVAPGDLVFSFVGTRIVAIGIAQSNCFESPKPTEFGSTGSYWQNIGWKIHIKYSPLQNQIRPQEHMGILRPILPERHSPLQSDGRGHQRYLVGLSKDFAAVVMGIIGQEAQAVRAAADAVTQQTFYVSEEDDVEKWENYKQDELAKRNISETERQALVLARRGQGQFKENVLKVEKRCRITAVGNVVHLIASHCKPWRHSSDTERLNGENGLLLTPSIDHLFDRGFIGFEDNGNLIIAPAAHRPSLIRMGIDTENKVNVGGFSSGQKMFLQYHRDQILLQAKTSQQE